MINIINHSQEKPYLLFNEKYDEALHAQQENIEAIAISSFNREKNEVDSRFVNLKFIDNNEFIFFSNYNSPKSLAFSSFDQISGLFFWSSTNVQIRIKAKLNRTNIKFNQNYFKNRSPKKNAISISSRQSEFISSYERVVINFNEVYKNNNLLECPSYWGGFSFIPYYFEFWDGHTSRINRREVFKKIDGLWESSFLQP